MKSERRVSKYQHRWYNLSYTYHKHPLTFARYGILRNNPIERERKKLESYVHNYTWLENYATLIETHQSFFLLILLSILSSINPNRDLKNTIAVIMNLID